jgi:hypothetical protein
MAKVAQPLNKKSPRPATNLRSLGPRLERLMRELEKAEKLQSEAGAALEKIAPKLTSLSDNLNTSATGVWDTLLDPSATAKMTISQEQHWRIIQHMYGVDRVLSFKSLKSMANKSGYTAAAERVRSINMELKDLAYRALKIRAANLADAKTQALAFLALGQVRYGWVWSFAREGVVNFSRSLVAVIKAQEARS